MNDIGGNMSITSASDSVPPEERRVAVLEFLYRHDIPLSPKAIYRGLLIEDKITFSYRTVQTCLHDLAEEDLVVRVNTSALDDGEIEVLSDDESGKRAWYYITDEGREKLS